MTELVHALPPPELRGRLHIADGVVETIARTAAAAMSPTRHVSGLGRLTSTELPRARVTVRAGHVDAALTVAAPWPMPAAAVARRVQETVSQRIGDLTGLTVGRVDVHVHCIDADDHATVGRVQ